MDRRTFLKKLGLTVGGLALQEAIPFNRVWSFPKEIKVVNVPKYTHLSYALGTKISWELIEDYTYQLVPRILMIHPDMLPLAKEILGKAA